MSSEQLLQIFYSGFAVGPNWIILDELEALIKNRAVSVTRIRIASTDEYQMRLDDESVIPDGPGPQGKGHAALKVIGEKFLRELGLIPKSEVYFRGLHPDIIDNQYTKIVECGTTDPSSILIFLEDEKVNWAGVIPYPTEGDQEIHLYKFIRNEAFSKYLEFKTGRLREAFRKARD